MADPFCAGIIILKKEHNLWHSILCQTKDGRWSFPKGKLEHQAYWLKHKKKYPGKRENYIDAAFRELNEETGLSIDDIDMKTENDGTYLYYDEMSGKTRVSVRYLFATYKHSIKDFIPIFDPSELTCVCWTNIEKILEKNFRLKSKRKAILQQILANNYFM